MCILKTTFLANLQYAKIVYNARILHKNRLHSSIKACMKQGIRRDSVRCDTWYWINLHITRTAQICILLVLFSFCFICNHIFLFLICKCVCVDIVKQHFTLKKTVSVQCWMQTNFSFYNRWTCVPFGIQLDVPLGAHKSVLILENAVAFHIMITEQLNK